MSLLKRQEVDAWWGNCSIKTILPGLVVSLAANGVVFALAWYLPRGSPERWVVLGLQLVSWLALIVYWGYQVFCINYRLTTHRLFVDIGLRSRTVQIVLLDKVSQVSFKTTALEKFLGVGRVFVAMQDPQIPTVILRGVSDPRHVAEKIKALTEQAQQG